MSEKARVRRKYHAPVRRAQAAETRAKIVAAAHEVFLARGYAGATIPAIAAAAGVAVETVYRAAAGKAGLLAAAVQAAVAGGVARADVPAQERPAIRRIVDEPDPIRQLELYAATQPGIWSRVGPLLRVLAAAASTDPTLTELRAQLDAQRRTGLRDFAALLAERGVLREGLGAESAADLLFTLCAQANHDALVDTCGWSPGEYERWLATTLADALLGRRTLLSE